MIGAKILSRKQLVIELTSQQVFIGSVSGSDRSKLRISKMKMHLLDFV